MAFDQNKPATTDNYSTAFVPGIQANLLALGMWLDSSLSGITGTIPTGFKRYNRTSGRIEEYNGSAWGNLTVNVTNADTATSMPYSGLTGAVPTWNQNTTGNAATATNLATNRTNWSTNGVLTAVVGQLAWKNYSNNHTIFDASAGTNPNGGAISNTNPANNWSPTYPTLMGFNGTDTYGLRVDSCRTADNALGVGQTWQSQSKVAANTAAPGSQITYTNSTGRTIAVSISLEVLGGSAAGIYINSGSYCQIDASAGGAYTMNALIPNGATYSAWSGGFTGSVFIWLELR